MILDLPRLGPTRGRVVALGLVAVLTAAARLPFTARPLSSDEGGFLLVASQWSPGRSLYGNYWVDRPPLLIAFFGLADRLGGTVPLRLLGTALAVASVLLAARIGRQVARRVDPDGSVSGRAELLAAVTAGAFLVTPLFGSYEVDGELVAVPLVLAGLVLLLRADAPAPAHRVAWLAAAGAAGAAAALVKQNEIDVLVFATVAALTLLRARGVRRACADLAAVATGSVALTGLVLVVAVWRGTDLGALWDAAVSFRLHASAVIQASSGTATTDRFRRVLLAAAVSGAVALPVLVAVRAGRLRRGPLRPVLWPALAVLGWELFSVLAGGSYWLHYLIALVPGLVLCAALVGSGRGVVLALARTGVAYAVVVATVATTYLLVHPEATGSEEPVDAWLSAHARPGDTAFVAYGHPDILQSAGLSSPYSGLWSLPVRVNDPRLTQLARVLAGPHRPTWVITTSDQRTEALAGWGIDPALAQRQLDAHYRPVSDVDGHVIYLVRSRPLVVAGVSRPGR